MIDRFSDGVIVNFEILEEMIIVGFSAKDVRIHVIHPLECTIELTIMSTVVKIEYFIAVEVRHLQVFIWLHIDSDQIKL